MTTCLCLKKEGSRKVELHSNLIKLKAVEQTISELKFNEEVKLSILIKLKAVEQNLIQLKYIVHETVDFNLSIVFNTKTIALFVFLYES